MAHSSGYISPLQHNERLYHLIHIDHIATNQKSYLKPIFLPIKPKKSL